MCCPQCGHGEVTRKVEPYEFPYRAGGERVMLTVPEMPYYTCKKCGFEYYNHEGERATEEAVRRYNEKKEGGNPDGG